MTRELPATTSIWHERFSVAIRSVLAPILFLWSGFFTADFVLSGTYTWPRTSRIFVLTTTLIILGYEFVYKSHRAAGPPRGDARARRAVRQACLLPYVAGVGLLLLIVFARR